MFLRLCTLTALGSIALVLAACSGDGENGSKPAAGTPGNPLVGVTKAANEAPKQTSGGVQKAPDYERLLESQSAKPPRRFTPCNLVTKAQARAIVGRPLLDPVEAPQGPTCIYRSAKGDGFVSLAVQAVDFQSLKREVSDRRPVELLGRTAVCGTHGQPTLYAPLAGDRVLAVTGQCSQATKFALKALRELSA